MVPVQGFNGNAVLSAVRAAASCHPFHRDVLRPRRWPSPTLAIPDYPVARGSWRAANSGWRPVCPPSRPSTGPTVVKGQAVTIASTVAVVAAGRRSSARSGTHILQSDAFPPCRWFAAMTAKSRENDRKIRESLPNLLPGLVPGEAAYLVGASWLSGAGAAASWVAARNREMATHLRSQPRPRNPRRGPLWR